VNVHPPCRQLQRKGYKERFQVLLHGTDRQQDQPGRHIFKSTLAREQFCGSSLKKLLLEEAFAWLICVVVACRTFLVLTVATGLGLAQTQGQ